MPGISCVATEFEKFLDSWQRERKHLPPAITSLYNGFESWLKFEFYFWLIDQRGLRGPSETEWGDVGVEYKVALDQRRLDIKRPRKQCDLWRRDIDESRFHYVELKAPFANSNQGKLFRSAENDLWCMSRIKAGQERPASGSVVILGVNFKEKEWKTQTEGFGQADFFREGFVEGTGTKGLFWAVASKFYPTSKAAT